MSESDVTARLQKLSVPRVCQRTRSRCADVLQTLFFAAFRDDAPPPSSFLFILRSNASFSGSQLAALRQHTGFLVDISEQKCADGCHALSHVTCNSSIVPTRCIQITHFSDFPTSSLLGRNKQRLFEILVEVSLLVLWSVASAVVVVVVTVANSAVSWYFRWPGGPWRPLLGLSEHAEPRW